MSRRFEGKVVIVSGAGSVGPGWGNGRAAAVMFAAEGAEVFGADRSLAAMEETAARIAEAGGRRRPSRPMRQNASVQAMVEACHCLLRSHRRAGEQCRWSAAGGPVEMSEEVWDAQVDFNLKSVFLSRKHVLPIMEAQGRGAIVNMASTSGIRWTGAAQVAYAACKAGVIQFGKVVAVQYAAKGIRVNTVVPGQMHTPMVEARLAGQRAGGDVDALIRQRVARIPMGCGGWAGYGERRAVSGLGRGTLHHRDRTGGGWRMPVRCG